MRQLFIKVPRGHGVEVIAAAKEHAGKNLAQLNGSDEERQWDVVVLQVPNGEVGPLLKELKGVDQLHSTLLPQSVLPMQPPHDTLSDHISDLSPLSPLEVWLNGLQSIGSWSSYLSYAVAASLVVWVAMFTNTVYLLVAAMLIAPFAGPAMNVAIGTASGDWSLVWRSTVRYFAALVVTVICTWLMSILLQQKTATLTMVNISEVSSMALLLPLVTGAAGALNLVQPERSSLVSGTAVGLLVAASLAPPAGLIGMAAAIGRWDMTVNAVFKLLLQLVGINLSGALVFRFFGLAANGARYGKGRHGRTFWASLGVTIIALAGLLFWQFSSAPNLQRSTIGQRAVAKVETVVKANEAVSLVEANIRFTRPSIQEQETLLGIVYVQQHDPSLSSEAVSQELRNEIQRELATLPGNITPLINVTVLESPE